jgi:uncharacterized protein (UPF0210 family)
MKIRSITCFFDPRSPQSYAALDTLSQLAGEGRRLFDQAGIEVQTTRLASVPFPLLYPTEEVASAVRLAQTLEADARQRGFDYLSLGPALPAYPASFDLVIPILEATEAVFLGGQMASLRDGLSLPAVRACAQIIHRAARLRPDGFTNLRFGALANLAPHGPFLPGAYHAGERPAFALAVESADLAVAALRRATSLADARQRLITALEDAATSLASRAVHLSQKYNVDFKGIDFSLAPFPADWCSLGAALEALGLPALGVHGSVAAAAFLADTLDRGRWLHTGFNGLMLPVQDLLLYATMCGAGLDTVPLPGDASVEQLMGVLLDVASIALRLNKPLIARLMPIPGRQAGDEVVFDFEYFARGRVMALPADALQGLLAGEETVSILPRGSF